MNYIKRLILPLEGFENINFLTKTNLHICKGYNRIVIGSRGPYIEFSDNNITKKNIYIPSNQKWRLEYKYSSKAYYIEYRSSCKSNVKIYKQLKEVDYADYKIGFWYISPFDLKSDKYEILISDLI